MINHKVCGPMIYTSVLAPADVSYRQPKVSALAFWSTSLIWELIRPRPQGALILWSGGGKKLFGLDWGNSLGGDGLGMNGSILLDGRDIGKGTQELYVSIGEGSSATVKDIPFIVRDPRVGANIVGEETPTKPSASSLKVTM